MGKLVLTSNSVHLPHNKELVPATIEIDSSSGKIVRVTLGKTDQRDYQGLEFWDLGNQFLLPGLVDGWSILVDSYVEV